MSCNKLGQYTCMRCKVSTCVCHYGARSSDIVFTQICFCEDHVHRKGVKHRRGDPISCPKCGYHTKETKTLSISSKFSTLCV